MKQEAINLTKLYDKNYVMEMEVLEFAKIEDKNFVKIKYIGKWNDYMVYEPIRRSNKIAYVGLPLCVLVGESEIRWTTDEEAMQILYESSDCGKLVNKKLSKKKET